ncbi:HEAT repeat domain-containing protein [Glaciihabitans arcticus]|uniref:HEAT repeat domain-containing protein n=1 Tax=Glaciihabitans arcticus TaxID=2668039 RepID=A0A4V2JEX4_9MICO|nr:HEAT repeat domain-containing protein [Glaciihabitans arcticus]TBN57269.1 HEAT repeat domain-containing protein [Glaciihabitans arcticus]
MRVPVELSHSARLRAAVDRYGERELVERAAGLLRTGEEDDDFLRYLGGRAAPGIIDGSYPSYWANAWGARALEYYWLDSATGAVIAGLDHEHWRVRMQCARVCAIRELGAPELLAALLLDENWRVRDATAWAVGIVGEFEHAEPLREATDDPHKKVRERATTVLDALLHRLERELD